MLRIFPILPILMGLGIILLANAVLKAKSGKWAPIPWTLATVVVTAFATGMLWTDPASKIADKDPAPFIILAVYGVVSAIFFAILESGSTQGKTRTALSWEELPESIQKRIRTSRVLAGVCAVIAGIGFLIVITGSSDSTESLPPTILFGIGAILCWAIANKKRYRYNDPDESEEEAQKSTVPVCSTEKEFQNRGKEGVKTVPSWTEYKCVREEKREEPPASTYHITPKESDLKPAKRPLIGSVGFSEGSLDDGLPIDEEPDAEEVLAKEVCARLKKSLRTDMSFWNETHLDFRCNLVTSYDQLELNYEIRNSQGIPWSNSEGGVEIKANVYNAEGDLLYVEEEYVDSDDLSRNRYSSSFLIYMDNIEEAAYMEIYAYRED